MPFMFAKDRMLLNIRHGGGLGNRLLERKDKLGIKNKIKSHINNTTSFKKDSKLNGHELFVIYKLFRTTFFSLFLVFFFPPYYFPLSGRKKFSSTL